METRRFSRRKSSEGADRGAGDRSTVRPIIYMAMTKSSCTNPSDTLSTRRRVKPAPPPAWIKPQLAALAEKAPDGPDWLHANPNAPGQRLDREIPHLRQVDCWAPGANTYLDGDHFASGAASGGMRWPNRTPHALTPGMRRAQRALAGFLPLIDWLRFQRRNLNDAIVVEGGSVAAFCCGLRNRRWSSCCAPTRSARTGGSIVSALPLSCASRCRACAGEITGSPIATPKTPEWLQPAADLAIAVRRL